MFEYPHVDFLLEVVGVDDKGTRTKHVEVVSEVGIEVELLGVDQRLIAHLLCRDKKTPFQNHLVLETWSKQIISYVRASIAHVLTDLHL